MFVAVALTLVGAVIVLACASLLIEQGAPIKAVQAQLGHQSAELTLDRYGHLYPDQMVVLAQRLEDARNGALLDDPKA